MKTKLLLFALVLGIFSCETSSETEPLNDGNLITSFTVKSGDTSLEVVINGTDIRVLIPYTLNLEALNLAWTLSEGAEINPLPSSITSLENGITFTVTAENGATRTYTLTVVRELSPENAILSFKIKDGDETLDAEIDTDNYLVSYTLPHTRDLTQIETEVLISEKATISPDPMEITDYSAPVLYTVTAENGESREYEVRIDRELSPENAILTFVILNDPLHIEAEIDPKNHTVSQKLPPALDAAQLQTEVSISEKATISPDPTTVTDYSSPVEFQVTSEKGETATYTVTLSPMTDNVYINCETDNASKWFGGDKRGFEVDPDYYFEPRNVGTGQSILPTQDLNITSFSIHFRGQFETTFMPYKVYEGELEIKLQLRNEEGEILASTSTLVQSPLTTSLWIKFDLAAMNLLLKKDKTYYFTWYLVNGEELGIYNGSTGNQDPHSGPCDGLGLSGTSKKLYETHLDDWEVWSGHPWHFNFRLEGKE